MLTKNILRFVVLAGLIWFSSYVAAEGDSSPAVKLYEGPTRSLNEVFILVLNPHLELAAVDGTPVVDGAREYHLLPGLHELKVHIHEWIDFPLYVHLPFGWQTADIKVHKELPAGRRGIMEYKTDGKKVWARLAPLGPSDLDGRWLGTVACEICENCEDAIDEPISIDVHNSHFEIALDMGAKGQGLINERGHMMIRKRGQETFSFFGTRKGDSFQLKGHIGSRTCKTTLHR
ncbi:MAG: hypothetical protein O7B81_03970 [Gammaproteobacteria bacterium]|nr:hypothetical protein [Gammaproteobacteria bacterium]